MYNFVWDSGKKVYVCVCVNFQQDQLEADELRYRVTVTSAE